jgi:hypothetical protein
MVRDDEIERIAVQEAIRHETERGWVIEGVEKDNRGFGIISRKPHPHDDETFIEVISRSSVMSTPIAPPSNAFATVNPTWEVVAVFRKAAPGERRPRAFVSAPAQGRCRAKN